MHIQPFKILLLGTSIGLAAFLLVLSGAQIEQSSAAHTAKSTTVKGDFSVDLATVLRTQNNAKVVYVDLRSDKLFSKLHLKDALNIPQGTLKDAPSDIVNKLKAASAIFVYCEDGQCAANGFPTDEFHKMGLRHAAFYKGGLREWAGAGLPVETTVVVKQEAKEKGTANE